MEIVQMAITMMGSRVLSVLQIALPAHIYLQIAPLVHQERSCSIPPAMVTVPMGIILMASRALNALTTAQPAP